MSSCYSPEVSFSRSLANIANNENGKVSSVTPGNIGLAVDLALVVNPGGLTFEEGEL
jgi:hypothetical protein